MAVGRETCSLSWKEYCYYCKCVLFAVNLIDYAVRKIQERVAH